MKEAFDKVRLSKANVALLDTVNVIIEEYHAKDFRLTLRQLYYQLVARDVIPNNPKEYKKLSSLLTKGRMGGVVDWAAIEDRVRQLATPNYKDNPGAAIRESSYGYRKYRQGGQDLRVEVWCEKDALSNVLWRMAGKYGVAQMVNRGYASATVMYDAAKRFLEVWAKEYYGDRATNANGPDNKPTVIMYFGDHDPSGLDMIRDVADRLGDFGVRVETVARDAPLDVADLVARGIMVQVRHFGITQDQIEKYKPPPNPAKVTDARAKDYIARHGNVSYEVDALTPEVLQDLIKTGMDSFTDMAKYNTVIVQEKKESKIMDRVADVLGSKSITVINRMLDTLEKTDPDDEDEDDLEPMCDNCGDATDKDDLCEYDGDDLCPRCYEEAMEDD